MTPTRRRNLVIALHWACVFLILTMIKGGVSTAWVLALFVGLVALWSGMTLVWGQMARPGPRLGPALRRGYPWMHRALHLLLALTALAILLRLLDRPLPFLDAWVMLLVTLSAGAFHGLFQVWRHTALYDNALAAILPRGMRKWL